MVQGDQTFKKSLNAVLSIVCGGCDEVLSADSLVCVSAHLPEEASIEH